MKKMFKVLFSYIFLISSVYSNYIWADAAVEVPADELATESVYPQFDHPHSVKNRNVQTEGRFDLGLFGGFALTEPIYSASKIGFAVNYHLSEYHSIGFLYSKTSTGLSKDAIELRKQNLDFDRAPKPVDTTIIDYNYKPFYGKLSLSKGIVINTTIYGSGAIGMVKYQHKSYPAIAIGLGERFYFTPELSFKVDLRMFAHKAPIPFKKCALKPEAGGGSDCPGPDPVPDYNDFDERLTFTNNLELGLNYLF